MANFLTDRLAVLRDQWLSSPRFRRLAAAFPLTRPIARRRARELFDLCAGFVYSQVLSACVRLQLFERLAAQPLTAAELAPQLALEESAVRRLLDAAVSLRLLDQRSGSRYGLGPLGAAMRNNPGISAMIEHHDLLYRDLADPLALLRAGRDATRLGQYWAYASTSQPDSLEAARVADYTALMSASQSLVAEEILDGYPLQGHRCLLDVGGGDGSFLAAVGARVPELQLMLFDLPAVAARAHARLDHAGLGSRATVYPGSFLQDELPRGADVVSLVRVVHDHDDDAARCLLAAVHRSLPRGGTLLIAEPMAGFKGAEAMADAYFGMYLWAMGQGRARTVAELTQLLNAVGFVEIRAVPTRLPLQTSLLVART
jgi:demethylspheroidene O-methyltransferase